MVTVDISPTINSDILDRPAQFLMIKMLSIWLSLEPSGNFHVSLWMLLCGKMVSLITQSFSRQKSIRRSALAFITAPICCIPVILGAFVSQTAALSLLRGPRSASRPVVVVSVTECFFTGSSRKHHDQAPTWRTKC